MHLLDARNHGASPHDAEMNYAAMAADVSAYIDVQCPDGAHLLGHSMGGKTAMLTALSSPRQVKSLVVADVAPVRYAHDFKAEITALRAVPLGTIKSRSEADAVVAEHFDDPKLARISAAKFSTFIGRVSLANQYRRPTRCHERAYRLRDA